MKPIQATITMHAVTHLPCYCGFLCLIDIHTLLRLFCCHDLIYVCYVSIHPSMTPRLIVNGQGLLLLSDGSLRDWFRRLPEYLGIL